MEECGVTVSGAEHFWRLEEFRFTCEMFTSISLKDCNLSLEYFLLLPDCDLTWAFRPQRSSQTSSHLVSGLQQLYLTEKLTDFALVANSAKETAEKRINVHKDVLAARSDVFRSMFDSAALENSVGECLIDGIDASTLQIIVDYLYDFPVGDDLESNSQEVYLAAEKYQLEELGEMCVDAMSIGLNVKNAAQTYVFARDHGLAKVAEKAVDFVRNNYQAFADVGGFSKIAESTSGSVATEFFKHLGQRLGVI